MLVAKAGATMVQPVIEHGIFLACINADTVQFERKTRPPDIQADKMRGQQNHRLSCCQTVARVLQPLDPHQPAQALGARPPGEAAFEQAAPKHRKMSPSQLLTRHLIKIGEAQPQVDPHHMATGTRKTVQQRTESFSCRCNPSKRQKMNGPQQGDHQVAGQPPHQSTSAGGTPAGRR